MRHAVHNSIQRAVCEALCLHLSGRIASGRVSDTPCPDSMPSTCAARHFDSIKQHAVAVGHLVHRLGLGFG